MVNWQQRYEGGSRKHPLTSAGEVCSRSAIIIPGLFTAQIRKAITAVCLLGLAAWTLAISCHCLSPHQHFNRKARTTHRSSLSLFFFRANTLPLCERLTAEMLSVAESPQLVFTVLSLCQSHPNASDACRACPLCAYACIVCLLGQFYVCACVYSPVFLFLPTGDTTLWSLFSSSMGSFWLLLLFTRNHVRVCVKALCSIGLNKGLDPPWCLVWPNVLFSPDITSFWW